MKTIQISDELFDQIQFLLQALPDREWNPMKDENQVLELIVWSFLDFVQEQANEEAKEGHSGEWHSCANC